MNLSDYVKIKGGTSKVDCPVLATLAVAAGCSHQTLYMIALGHKRAGHGLAKAIELATRGAVSRHDLRSDIFGDAPAEPRSEAA